MSEAIEQFDFDHKGRKFLARVYRDDDHGAPWENEDGHGPVRESRDIESKRAGERVLFNERRQLYFYDWQEAMKIARRDGWGALPGKLETKQINATTFEARCTGFVALGGDINEAIGNLYNAVESSMTPGQYAALAVQSNYDRLRRWCNGDWHYVGVSVTERPDYSKAIDALESHDAETIDGVDWAGEAIEALRELQDAEPEETYLNALWGIESDAGDYLQEVARELAEDIIG